MSMLDHLNIFLYFYVQVRISDEDKAVRYITVFAGKKNTQRQSH